MPLHHGACQRPHTLSSFAPPPPPLNKLVGDGKRNAMRWPHSENATPIPNESYRQFTWRSFISQSSVCFVFIWEVRITFGMTIICKKFLSRLAFSWHSLQFAFSLCHTGKWTSRECKNHSSLDVLFALSLGVWFMILARWTESKPNYE